METLTSNLVTTDNFELHLLALRAADEIALDTETTGLNVRNKVDYLMGISYSVNGSAGYFPFRHPDTNLPRRCLDSLVDAIKTKPLIWHNQKFDYHSLNTIGVDPLSFVGQQYDTMMIAHLINEEWYSKELDHLCKMLLKEEKIDKEIHKWGEAFGRENIPASIMSNYATQDAVLTRKLLKVLWPRLVAQHIDKVYLETEEPFCRLLYKMEQRGVGTNPEFCAAKARLGRMRMETIARELHFNPGSPKDVGEYLIEELELPVLRHTDSCIMCTKVGLPPDTHVGKPSFNKAAMEEYDEILQDSDNPAAKLISEYRGWQKAVTSLYEPMLEKVGPDGLIRTEFKQHGTVTGRLSAQGPNLQQVPRSSAKKWNGNAKSAFWSGRQGYTLIGWDYSQLELRLAAAYGQESLLLDEFKSESADPFNVLAPLIFGELTPETRYDTKTFVYANLYGAGLKKIAAQLGRPTYEVEELYENYKRSIPGIMAISNTVSNLVKRRGWVSYWDGRRRHIRDKSKSYKAWNSVCQGGGAQLVKQAMLRCQDFEDSNCFMVLQVHDEITFCIKDDFISKYEPLIVEAMTDWPEFGVNFHVEGKIWQ